VTVGNANPVDSGVAAIPAAVTIMAVRPWRTPRLPDLVGASEAAEILGVQKMTLNRWLRPGSGTPDWSHGPDRTYMIEPKRIRSGPVWVREDVERFAREIGRQRALSDRFKQQA
jgi:hypothetical protein